MRTPTLCAASLILAAAAGPSCLLGQTGGKSTPAAVEGEPTGLVFSSDRDGPLQLYLLSLKDGSVRRLTRSQSDERDPSVAPDGRHIVFQSVADRRSELFVLDLDEGGVARLTTSGHEREPCFSPDGRRIVFTSARDGDSAIYAMDADGSGAVRLSPPGARDRSPAFSPDGNRISFVSKVDGDPEVFVMDADGSARKRLTEHAGDDSHPSWSPDGGWLAFSASETGKHDDIVRMASDGSDRLILTGSGSIRADYMDRNVASWDASISPDGRHVAFCSIRDGNAELYLLRAQGSELRRLTDDPAQDLSPAWLTRAPREEGSR